MTVYRRGRRPQLQPTLRLRLTLLNGAVLAGAGLAGVLLALAGLRWWGDPGPAAGAGPLVAAAVLVVGAAVVAGTVGSWLLAGRALRPLHQVTATARRLGEETLDQRIHYSGAADEVAELAATFDAMLDRLAEAFETQKRFVANASHELRTPLAVMRTEVDVTLDDAEADLAEYQRMARVVRDASARANGLVEALLVLARSEAQSGRRLVRKVDTDLATGAAAALTALDKEVARLSLEVTADLRPAPVVGDPRLLERLAGNLIENAVRYNHLHGGLWVRTGTAGDHARLVVANTGFEVDPADVPGLFEPFRRGGRERTGARGAGLGLAIVRAVCEAHGGTVGAVARGSADGGGLEVTVTLPAADTTPVVAATATVPTVAP